MKKALIALALTMTTSIFLPAQDLKTSTDRSASDYLEDRFGMGLMVGEPIGLTLKYWLNESWAVDGAIAESFHRENGLQLHSDILWHKFGVFDVSEGRLPLYFGAGVRGKFQDGDDEFGIRFPIGVTYMFDNRPIDVFFEVAPILTLTPSVRGDFNVVLGARFWF